MQKKIAAAVLAALCGLSLAGCTLPGSISEGEVKEEKKDDGSYSREAGRLVYREDVLQYLTLGEYKNLPLSATEAATVTDAMVEEEVSRLLAEDPVRYTSDVVAQIGDEVMVDYYGTFNGEPFEGSTGSRYVLTLGKNQMIPGFEEALIGMSPGQSKTVTLTAIVRDPDGVETPRSCEFTIVLISIDRAAVETKQWLEDNGYYDSTSLRESIRAELSEQALAGAEEKLRRQAWEFVWNSSYCSGYPEGEIELAKKEYRKICEKLQAASGMDWESYLSSQGMSEEDYEASALLYAQNKAKQNMIIQAIMDAEGLSLTDSESVAIRIKFLEENKKARKADDLVLDDSVALLRVQNFMIEHAAGSGAAVSENTVSAS